MKIPKVLLLIGVGAISAAVGVAVPVVMSGGTKTAHADAEGGEAADGHHGEKPDAHAKADAHAKPDDHGKADAHAKPDDKHGGDGHGKGGDGHGTAPVKTGPQFIPFGRIVVNLNEAALTKYLSLDITLLADAKDESEVLSGVEKRLPILRTWLTSHLADKSMEDIRGKVGINRLRREIQDQFNALLFDDGHERVRDVLFEEFHVE